MTIGERVEPRYLAHPPASSGLFDDGDPVDAGSAHVAHSNVSNLAERNVRLVAHVVGPGEITNASASFAGVIDVTPDSAEIYGTIPWVRESSAFMCGPLALTHSRLGTSPAGYYPRKIRVVVQAFKGGAPDTTLRVLAVLTSGPDTPMRSQRYAQVFATITDAFSGARTFDLTLSVEYPLRPSQSWRCRSDGTTESAATGLVPAWVWVGWGTDAIVSPDRIDSVSVFEVFE